MELWNILYMTQSVVVNWNAFWSRKGCGPSWSCRTAAPNRHGSQHIKRKSIRTCYALMHVWVVDPVIIHSTRVLFLTIHQSVWHKSISKYIHQVFLLLSFEFLLYLIGTNKTRIRIFTFSSISRNYSCRNRNNSPPICYWYKRIS